MAGAETWEILCRLAAQMGYRFKMKYATVEEVTAEIGRLIPAYQKVDIDSRNGESLWALDTFKLKPVGIDVGNLDTPITPLRTQDLDYLEKRFSKWFDAIMAAARQAREREAVTEGEGVAQPV
jgi:hypothetical protein